VNHRAPHLRGDVFAPGRIIEVRVAPWAGGKGRALNYDLLLYGSYGYTGSLIVAEALQRGLRPLLAGRDAHGLAGQAPPGFQTPGKAYGPDFILGLPGVQREDLAGEGAAHGS